MTKADLHVHSKYSRRSSEFLLNKIRSLESYSEPETIYQIAKERGMDFVTITDHNEIEGSLILAEKYPDAFTGTELTTFFPEDRCKIHLLIYGLTGGQFEEILKLSKDIYRLQEYIVAQKLAISVAHGAYSIDSKLDISHLEKLVLMFDVFETVNGSKNRVSNEIWHRYLKYLNPDKLERLIDKHKIKPQHDDSWQKGFTGGSDDHAGFHIGHTYTTAKAENLMDFLAQISHRKSVAEGKSNDFKKLVLSYFKIAHDYSKQKRRDARSDSSLENLLDRIFKESGYGMNNTVESNRTEVKSPNYIKRQLLDLLAEIENQESSAIDRNLDLFYDKLSDIADELIAGQIDSIRNNTDKGKLDRFFPEIAAASPALFLFLPFISGIIHLNKSRKLLNRLESCIPIRTNKKILWFSDTFNDINGVSVTLKKLGWQFWADGIDVRFATCLLENELSDDLPPNVMNLRTCYHFLLPYYEDYCVKIPSVLKAFNEIDEYQPDEIFVSTPGPLGILGIFLAKIYSIPLTGVYHTDFTLELCEMMDMNSVIITMEAYIKWFYSVMDEIKVPTKSYMDILEKRGLDRRKMSIFPRHIDSKKFTYHPPDCWDGTRVNLPEGLNLLYVGRVSKDKNLEFLVDVYREIRSHRSDINLIVTGNGPYRLEMQAELDGDKRVIFTGSIPNERMPMIYSQAHALVFPSVTDTYGMAVLEAQCCELPAFVSDKGGPQEIIDDGNTGHVLPALNLERWVNSLLQFDDMVRNQPDQYQALRKRTRIRAVKMSGWDIVLKNLTRHELIPDASNNTKYIP